MKILVSITTIYKNNWIKQIKEVKKYNLKEVVVFLTGLNYEKRQEFYRKLKETPVVSIPHMHARSDMRPEEFQFFIDNYKTKVFNLHSEKEFPLQYDYSKYKDMIYLENACLIPDQDEIDKWAGLCVDFSHWEGHKKVKKEYVNFQDLVEKNKVGCCHVSAIRKGLKWLLKGKSDSHKLWRLKDLNYLSGYKKYLPEYVSLELVNSIKRQLQAKKYLEEKVLRT